MMRTVVVAAGLAASVLAAAPSARGADNDFAYLDLGAARTPAEQLVVCDRTRLFSNAPDPDATRVFVNTDDIRFDLAMPPDYTRPSGWYDEQVERAHRSLSRRGLVSKAEVEAVRDRYRTPSLTRAERPGVGERSYLRRQSRACEPVLRALMQG